MRVDDTELVFSQDLRCWYRQKPFTGVAVELYADGQVRSELPYIDGLQEGIGRDYYPTGERLGESEYRHNDRHGATREWYRDGQLKLEQHYEAGVLVSEKRWGQLGELLSTWELEADSPYWQILNQA